MGREQILSMREASASFLPPTSSISLTATYNNATRQAWPGWIMCGCRPEGSSIWRTPADDISRSRHRNGSGHGFQFVELPSGCQSVEVTDIHQVKGNTAHAEWNQCCLSGSNRRFAGVCRLLRLVLPDASVDRIGGQPGSHGGSVPELLMVYPNSLEAPAQRLAQFHRIVLVSLWKPFPGTHLQ